METYDIHAHKRPDTGKAGLKRLRGEGFVPGVVYGGTDSVPIALAVDEIRSVLDRHGEDVLIRLELEGRSFMTRVREVQREPVNQEIRHVDLMPLDSKDIQPYLH